MKKLLAMLLCFVFVCGVFAGCGGNSKVAYKPGETNGDVFTSEWIGIEFTKNDDYIYATDEELLEMLDASADAYYYDQATDTEIVDYAKANSVIEMMATSLNGDNVLLMTEKLALSNITMDQYIESFQTQMDGQGMTYEGRSTKTFAGKEFVSITYSLDIGIVLYQDYYLYKQDNRMVAIIVTYFDTETRDMLLDCFKAIEAE